MLGDKDGNEFHLSGEVRRHIQYFHPKIKDVNLLKQVLADPDCIVKSNWDRDSRFYYKRIEKYFKAIVVQIKERRIKTAPTVDKIKKGEIIRQKKQRTKICGNLEKYRGKRRILPSNQATKENRLDLQVRIHHRDKHRYDKWFRAQAEKIRIEIKDPATAKAISHKYPNLPWLTRIIL
jgi:hypothetical protein